MLMCFCFENIVHVDLYSIIHLVNNLLQIKTNQKVHEVF